MTHAKHLDHRSVLGERFHPRRNALNTLRLVFATAVIVAHSFPIGGFTGGPFLGGMSLGTFSVAAFFVASGYLITESRERNSLFRYGWARFLRIYPGFWVCLLLTAFVFAPVAGFVRGGWHLSDAVSYVVKNSTLSMAQFDIGDTLSGAPYTEGWNGSLWTLIFEFGCYVIIGVFLSVRRFRTGWWVFGLFALFSVASVFRQFGAFGPLEGIPARWAMLVPFFLAGSVVYKHRYSLTMSPVLFAASAAAVIGSVAVGWGVPISPLPLAYCVMWLAALLPQVVERFRDGKVDISYGMYIYAFPIQQLIVLAGVSRWGVTAMIIASVAVTVIPAALSWYLIEKPCLSFKSTPWPVRWRPAVGSDPRTIDAIELPAPGTSANRLAR